MAFGRKRELVAGNAAETAEKLPKKRLPLINFRPILFCALGLALGIQIYTKIRFGGISASDFLFFAFFLVCAIRPYSWRRVLCTALSVLIFAGAGLLSVHLYTENYCKGLPAGEYEIAGTVEKFTVQNGYTSATLGALSLSGNRVQGKLQTTFLSEEIRAGDTVLFQAKLSRGELPEGGDSYSLYLYENDVRYIVGERVVCERTGKSRNPFLLLNAAVYDALQGGLGKDEADVAYALLSGNSNGIDGELIEAIRRGGIAHAFAVSGLHIGILYGAVSLLFKPLLRKKSFLPALAAAVCYAAVCSFTVSSIRALVMCAALSVNGVLGRKSDFLNSVSFAAICVLLFLPAQWLAAGFRLSFGACLGLALFMPWLNGLFRKLPKFLGGYLAANLSVQVFTFPVLAESFGYVSVWGTLLNLLFIPLLPVLFLGLLICTLLALIVPPAAWFFLMFPNGMLSALLYVFSVADFSMVLTGFSLGAGAAVWVTGAVALSQRFRMRALIRAAASVGFALLFTACLLYENAVFYGCKISAYESRSMNAALLRTGSCAVLVIDGDVTLARCNEYLSRSYGGKLDGVVVLAEDELRGINVGAFLNTQAVYVKDEIPTGLHKTKLVFGEAFTLGGMQFRFESREKLAVIAEGSVVEIDFENNGALGADLFVGKGSGSLKYFLKDGIIKAL